MPGLYLPQFKDLIVRPALAAMGLQYASEAAVSLVTGTALVESEASFFKQMGLGPATSLWQIEPATLEDIWFRWLRKPENLGLRSRILDMIPLGCDVDKQIVFDLRFGAIMCRCRYFMSPNPLPAAGDAAGMAQMHKAVYNTADGAAIATRNTPIFLSSIAA